MEAEELTNISPESLLIVNGQGLKRLKCPFSVFLLVALEGLEEGVAYKVRLVHPHQYHRIVYMLEGQRFHYPYHYFAIL